MSTYTPLTIDIAIEQHLAGAKIGSLVSIRDAVALVRLFAPEARVSDQELANRIAWAAIAKNCNVSFDFEFENEQRKPKDEIETRTAA
ncbi:hypothetical protein [Aquibium oceanicum]|uniref:Uncharacterized protein n=1 Tax=Aquibium oceanicum TaxID=1670800 RepID=A0A1L3SLS1_9HYPH|nr:hypothetical protein [Aquibium oceanicum]APH70359.1 hypothetical protein BSQ44_02400 [Aquibium oceanicum]